MAKINTAQLVTSLAKPITDSLNLELVEVEFIKEAGNWYLRVYIDKDSGVGIEDCENVSKKLGSILDEEDPIENSYFLEVSSPGLDRPLKKDSDFVKYKGKDVEIKLYKPFEGKKAYEGQLEGLMHDKIVITDQSGKTVEFNKKDVSLVKLAVKL